jgi:polyisoprenoid-binding protein YceI
MDDAANKELTMSIPNLSNPTTSAASAGVATLPRPGVYHLDAAHSHVGFSVRHMMISNVRGEFQKVAGTVTYDPARPEATSLSISIDVASINTREEKRDAHLRSADFFDAERYPAITFVSTGTRRDGEDLQVTGTLTIAGTTRPVTLAIQEITPEHTDPWGNLRLGATARTKIRRSDFGMKWNAALEAGGVLVGDEVSIQIEAELIKQK